MKKIFILSVILSTILILPVQAKSKLELPEVTEHQKVKVHIFYGKKCEYCHDLLKFLQDNYKQLKDYIEIDGYETENNEANDNFRLEVFEELVPTTEYLGIPLTIIGSDYYIGFDEDIAKDIVEGIKNNYTDEYYGDQTFDILRLSTKEDITVNSYKEMLKISGLNTLGTLGIILIIVLVFGITSGIFYILIKKGIVKID